jgi:hypothetical protein
VGLSDGGSCSAVACAKQTCSMSMPACSRAARHGAEPVRGARLRGGARGGPGHDRADRVGPQPTTDRPPVPLWKHFCRSRPPLLVFGAGSRRLGNAVNLTDSLGDASGASPGRIVRGRRLPRRAADVPTTSMCSTSPARES